MALNLSANSACSEHVMLFFFPSICISSFLLYIWPWKSISGAPNNSQCSSVSPSFRKFRARNNLLLYTWTSVLLAVAGRPNYSFAKSEVHLRLIWVVRFNSTEYFPIFCYLRLCATLKVAELCVCISQGQLIPKLQLLRSTSVVSYRRHDCPLDFALAALFGSPDKRTKTKELIEFLSFYTL